MLTFIINKLYVSDPERQSNMKIIFNIAFPGGLLLALAAFPTPASAYAYFTQDALLDSFFPDGASTTVTWTPTADERAALTTTLGYAPPKDSYTFFVDGGASPTAYALIDEQNGQHEPITFGVKLRADATIERIEVMIYREAYGDGVRAESFRGQFDGLSFKNPMRAGKEIQIVSGATISTRALAIGARRASALLATWLQNP